MPKIRISDWAFYSPVDLARKEEEDCRRQAYGKRRIYFPKGRQSLYTLRLEKSKVLGGNRP